MSSSESLSRSNDSLRFDLMAVSSFLSIAGSMFIIVSFIAFPNLRKFHNKLVMWVSVADVGASIMYAAGAIGGPEMMATEGSCKTFAFFMQIAPLTTVFWTFAFALNLYLVVVAGRSQREVVPLEKWYHAVCWGVPLLTGFIGLWASLYGPAGHWCWLKSEKKGMWLLFFYLELWSTMGFIAFVYGAVALKAYRGYKGLGVGQDPESRAQHEQKEAKIRTLLRKLALYPTIFLLTWLGSTVNRLYGLANDSTHSNLEGWQMVAEPLQGLMNAFVYGYTENMLKEYKRWWNGESSSNAPLTQS